MVQVKQQIHEELQTPQQTPVSLEQLEDPLDQLKGASYRAQGTDNLVLIYSKTLNNRIRERAPKHYKNSKLTLTRMPLGNAFRTTSDTALENIVRSVESEAVLRDVFCRIMGGDYFSRDPDVRRSGLQSASSLGAEYTVEEAVRLDDIRRSVPPFAPCPPFWILACCYTTAVCL